MNYYISRLNQEELIELVNNAIRSANDKSWDGGIAIIEDETNYILVTENQNGSYTLYAKRVVGEYAVFDLGEFLLDDYTMTLLVNGKAYRSFDKELHEYLAVRFGSNYIDDNYEHEQEIIVKEKIRLTLMSGKLKR